MKKVGLALTEKHLGSIHEGLEGDEKVAHVGASKEVGFKLWQVSDDFVNLGPLVVSYTLQPSATCILNIALPTCDGCDKF